jgi:hypothetical protein
MCRLSINLGASTLACNKPVQRLPLSELKKERFKVQNKTRILSSLQSDEIIQI